MIVLKFRWFAWCGYTIFKLWWCFTENLFQI